MKRINEGFYKEFFARLDSGMMGTCAFVLQEISKPDIKQTKSVMSRCTLRIGDCDTRSEEAIALMVRTSKCTAISRPSSWSKYGIKTREDGDDDDNDKTVYVPLKMHSFYYIDKGEEDDTKMETNEDDGNENPLKYKEQVEKETLVRGYKYGSTYVPCPDGEFAKLPTKAGLEICGFFLKKNVRFSRSFHGLQLTDWITQFRRELSMGEIQYVWADVDSPNQQVAMSSIVRAMVDRKVYAIARWVTKDDRAPKMGVLAPTSFEEVDCLLWAPVRNNYVGFIL